MNTSTFSNFAIAVAATAVFAAQAIGQGVTERPQQPAAVAPKRVIVVSLEDHKLALVEDGQLKKVYSVAVGKHSTPSPTGTFTIERRVANPTYHHNGKTVLPGPNNPVGTRWMGLSKHGYGIHGTNEPNSIGRAASHGCIRMARTDLEEFYALVAEGDTVEMIGQPGRPHQRRLRRRVRPRKPPTTRRAPRHPRLSPPLLHCGKECRQ
jgi:lipoprotein-anchoring transpeptidase ErfK/SrfK